MTHPTSAQHVLGVKIGQSWGRVRSDVLKRHETDLTGVPCFRPL